MACGARGVKPAGYLTFELRAAIGVYSSTYFEADCPTAAFEARRVCVCVF